MSSIVPNTKSNIMKKKTIIPPADSRRNFLKKAGLGGLSAGLLLNESIHEQLEYLVEYLTNTYFQKNMLLIH